MAVTDMAQYDLTTKLVANLDRHLTIPLLDHLAETELFPSSQIAKAQYVFIEVCKVGS
jgi:translation initiation factor 3 subunit E